MSADDVTAALDNLESIKNGDDPRSGETESTSTRSGLVETVPAPDNNHPIVAEMKAEAERTLEEYPFLTQHIDMTRMSFYVADWKRRRGLCTYNQYCGRDEFGQQLNKKDDFDYAPGSHAIGLATRVYEEDNGWEETVRHEIAHAYLFNKHGESQEHNQNFKQLNQRIDGGSGGKHVRDDYEYAVSCPEGCFVNGKHKRSKTVKKPWKYRCPECEANCVSHDYEADVPDEAGVCAVASIDWRTGSDYLMHPTKEL